MLLRFLKKRPPADARPEPSAPPPPGPEVLAEQALHHAEARMRHEALRQLRDPALLRQVMANEGDAIARDIATARYRTLLSAESLEPAILPLWRDEIAALDDRRLLEQLAAQAGNPEIRHAAIARVRDPAVLAGCALRDARALNRGLAVERLEDRAALEQVAREIGKRDKQVHRIAREKLRLIQEREALPRRVAAQREELCEKVERLGRIGNWSQDRALLEHLDRQWAALEVAPAPELRARWEAGRAAFMTAWEVWRDAQTAQTADREARLALQARAAALLDDFAALPVTADTEILAERRARLAADWAALGPLPDECRQELGARYDRLVQAADTALNARSGQKRDAGRLERLTARIQNLLAESRPVEMARTVALLKDARTLAAARPDTPEALVLAPLAERLDARLGQQRRHAEQRLRQLPERLTELEARLAAGELRKADPLYQSLQAGLELIQVSGFPKAATADTAARLHRLAPQLRELQHWRRWGADQHREGLCAEMETLQTQELPLAAVAERLRLLRADWKALDHAGSPANQALWGRFHAAAERVHARCRPFLETESAARAANLTAREAVCQQLEDFLARVDWERVDWKKTLRAEREIRQAWAAIGPVDGRRRKPLERRFHQALRQLDRHLDAERKRNQALKHNLIAEVETLAGHPDLETAIERTKALQRDWHSTVPGRHKDENRLWQQFRAACDAVFERRAARHQAQASELHEHLALRESICAEAQALAERETDRARLIAALRDLDERWRAALELPVPRQSAAALTQRWHDGRDRLEAALDACEDRRRRAWLDRLAARSALCASLEREALDAAPGTPPAGTAAPDAQSAGTVSAPGIPPAGIAAPTAETAAAPGTPPAGTAAATPATPDPDAWRQQWTALDAPAPGEPAAAGDRAPAQLARRFERALAALTDDNARAALRAERPLHDERRRQICLQLEILAGLESPPAFAQQRLAIQVARLAERMAEGEEDPLRGAEHLLLDWHAGGPATPDPELEDRFARARDRLLPSPPSAPSA